MKRATAHITRGGQISIPAAIRKRWATSRLALEDKGDEIVLRPLPADPIDAAFGSIKLPPGITVEGMRTQFREEEAEAEERRYVRRP